MNYFSRQLLYRVARGQAWATTLHADNNIKWGGPDFKSKFYISWKTTSSVIASWPHILANSRTVLPKRKDFSSEPVSDQSNAWMLVVRCFRDICVTASQPVLMRTCFLRCRCLTERAMAWQDRATNALKSDEVLSAMKKLSEFSQPRWFLKEVELVLLLPWKNK